VPATAVPSMVAYCTVTGDVDAAESVALKVIVAPCGDAMACGFEKLSVGSAAGLADAPPVTAIKAVAATESARAPRTMVLYIARPVPYRVICPDNRVVRRLW